MSGHPRTHQNAILRTYAGLLLISICVYTLMYAPQPMFNSVSRDFGVDKGSTGLLVSVFMLSLAVSPLCVGMLLSRIGVRRAILGASLLLGISGVGIWFAPSFLVLLGIRALQALLVPVVLTAVMSGIAVMFRHLDLNRALAGYVTSNLVGSLCGRIIGGWAAQMFGWRATLAVICFFFFLVLADKSLYNTDTDKIFLNNAVDIINLFLHFLEHRKSEFQNKRHNHNHNREHYNKNKRKLCVD